MNERVKQADDRILAAVQRWRRPLWDKVMPIVTHLGDLGAVWVLLGAVLFFTTTYREEGILLVGSIALCAVVCNLMLKPLFRRSRPFQNKEADLLIDKPMDHSFPSGHTMASFTAAAVLFGLGWPVGLIALAAAFAIGFSRLYLFVHYPSDVAAGAVFGSLLGTGCLLWGQPAAKLASRILSALGF